MRHSRPLMATTASVMVAAAVALSAGAALAPAMPSVPVAPAAQDSARVLSSTPVIQQVAVPRQVCTTQQVVVPGQRSGAGAAMGAIAGGAIGNSIGEGGGRAAATLLGLVGGAMLGDRIEGPGASSVQNVQQCTTQTFYENRTIGYNVIYEYAGRQYQVQLPQDPGPTVRIQITPVSELPAEAPVAAGSVIQIESVPQPVVSNYTTHVYPAAAANYVPTPTYVPSATYVAPSPVWSTYVPAVIVGSALYWGVHSWGYRPHVYNPPRFMPRPGYAYGGGHRWGGGHRGWR